MSIPKVCSPSDIKFKKDIIEILKIYFKNDYFLFKFEDLDVNDIILIRIEKKKI